MNLKKVRTLLLAVVGIIAVIGLLIYSIRISHEEKIRDAIASAWNETVRDDDPAYLQEITRLSSYEIIGIEHGDFYTVNVTVKGIDLGSELEKIDQKDFPQDENAINKFLIEIIGQCSQVETAAVIYAERTEKGYEISFSDAFVDAMSGKIYSYYMREIEEMMGGS